MPNMEPRLPKSGPLDGSCISNGTRLVRPHQHSKLEAPSSQPVSSSLYMLTPPLQNLLPQILNITVLLNQRSLLAPYRLRLHRRLITTQAPRLPARLTGRFRLAGLIRVSLVGGVWAGLRIAVLPAAAGAVAVFAGAAVVAVD